MKRRIFVYGTLLSGEVNHRLLEHARFVGPARTSRGFELCDLGPYPGLIRAGERQVRGEVYEVDEWTLAALDRFEGHPGFYRRTRIDLDGGGRADAYVLPAGGARGSGVIASGCWRSRRAGVTSPATERVS